MAVSQIWQGYAARLFISFGKLTDDDVLAGGTHGYGEYELTNMDSFSDWTITIRGKVLVDSDSCRHIRQRRLQRLLGRRLLSMQIEEESRSTILIFSRELILTTATMDG